MRPPRPIPLLAGSKRFLGSLGVARKTAAIVTIAAIAIATIAGCADTLRRAGASPAVSETNADQLFEAVVDRFSPVDMSPRYDVARVKMAQSALIPSRVFNDTSVWGAPTSPTSRILHIAGGLEPSGHYHLDIVPALPPAARLGDSRHTITLDQLAPNQYGWNTDVELAIGGLNAQGMSDLILGLLGAPDGRTEQEVRADYRAAFPRALAAFGHGFSLDSLHITPGALGTTSVSVTVGFQPDLMRPMYPNLAQYVDKYLGPAKYRFVLSDKSGVTLVEAVGRDRSVTVHYRLQQHALTSLFGPPRAWSDSLELLSNVSLKVKIFTVGFHQMVTDFQISNSGHDRAWTVVAQHEPQWDLPFITERLIRSPLRRPFEGAGAMFRLGIRDSAGGQSMFSRRTRLEVQESAIMKFIGGLVSHALGDLDTRVESEEDRFLHDGFEALRADLKALAPRW